MEVIKKDNENINKNNEKTSISDVITHSCIDCGGKLEYDVMNYWQCSVCGKPQ